MLEYRETPAHNWVAGVDDCRRVAVNTVSRPGIIYALHLGDGDYRYVGQTIQHLRHRIRHHLNDASSGVQYPVHQWIRKHGRDAIHYRVLEYVQDLSILSEREMYWIARFRMEGMSLLNATDGGDGAHGVIMSNSGREALRRIRTGEANHRSVLTDELVLQILQRLATGEAIRPIAEDFGVSINCISAISTGRTWRHVPRPEGYSRHKRLAKLSDEQVHEVLNLLAAGWSKKDVAKKYSVTDRAISSIATGKNRKSISRDGAIIRVRPPMRYLTEVEVVQIIDLLNHGFSQSKVAEMFDSNRATIASIAQGKSWKHVPRNA